MIPTDDMVQIIDAVPQCCDTHRSMAVSKAMDAHLERLSGTQLLRLAETERTPLPPACWR